MLLDVIIYPKIVAKCMKVVKLGGSVITNKRVAGSRKGARARFIPGVARRLLKEIRDSKQEVVLVTGAGSFGHVLADRNGLKEGFREDGQWDGYCEVSRDVRRLNLLVLDEALRLGMRLISIPPSVSVLQAEGKIHYLDEGVFRRYLAQGITPVTFGDVSLDMGKRRFSICGGDALALHLSQLFGADRAIFVSDVDGILVGERGQLAREFTREDLGRITPRKGAGGKEVADVTGGIAAKARLSLELAASGTETVILNGRKRGRLLDALKGGGPVGTWFRRPPA
jgi:isopentenyl phosphate kinase